MATERQLTDERYRRLIANPHVAKLADEPRWTISDPDKMPISINSLILHYGPQRRTFERQGRKMNYYGASISRPEDMVDLHTLVKLIPSAPNFAFHLHDDKRYAVLDIEPKATDETKSAFLATPWLYAERSMSGNGYHLLIPYPNDLLTAFPDAYKSTLKSQDNTYELHIAHWLTFTGNVVDRNETYGTKTLVETLMPLFRSQKPKYATGDVAFEPIEDPVNDIAKFDHISEALCKSMRWYKKRPADFAYDQSRFDMSLLYYMTHQFITMSEGRDFDIRDYTLPEVATIVGMSAHRYQVDSGSDRQKYHTIREGVPFLVWRAYTSVSNVCENAGIQLKGMS